MKLTPWFPLNIKPVRSGVYNTSLGNKTPYLGFSHWNGRRWSDTCASIEGANQAIRGNGMQDKKWRGLAAKQK